MGHLSPHRGAGFGPEVKRRIMLGAYALSAGYYDAYYLKAQQVRTLIKQDFDLALAEVDVIACPTSPTTAFRIGEKAGDPLSMYLADIFTLSLNLAGICGLSLPCGFDGVGLPIGLQLIARAFAEDAAAANRLRLRAGHRVASPKTAIAGHRLMGVRYSDMPWLPGATRNSHFNRMT